MWSFHRMKYYSTVEKKEVLISATMWMKHVYNEQYAK